MSLSSDDPEYTPVELHRRREQTEQPYVLAALMVSVIALLAARLLVRSLPNWPFWVAAALLFTFVYNFLIIFKPRLPLMLLAVIAAQLGLLLSMPIALLFVAPWKNPAALGQLISFLIIAGVVGAFMAWVLSVDRYPSMVIAINFLLMFVLVGFVIVGFGYLSPH